MQVEDDRHGVAQGAGTDLCPSRGKGERGFPQQTLEEGLQPELGSTSTFTSFNVTPAGDEGKTSPLGIGVREH